MVLQSFRACLVQCLRLSYIPIEIVLNFTSDSHTYCQYVSEINFEIMFLFMFLAGSVAFIILFLFLFGPHCRNRAQRKEKETVQDYW